MLEHHKRSLTLSGGPQCPPSVAHEPRPPRRGRIADVPHRLRVPS